MGDIIAWALTILQSYWPAILILLGVGSLFAIDDIVGGIIGLVFYGGLGILFFIHSPSEVWSWLSQFESVQFLIAGKWYEVVLKVTGAIAAVGLALKLLAMVLRGIQES